MSKPIRLHSGEEGAVFGQSGNKWLAGGASVPADATVGYEAGCIFVHTDGSAGGTLYINDGSDTSALFKAVQGVGSTAGVVTVADAATYTVLAADSGKTHLISEMTASCTLSLPAAAAGLEYEFIMKGVATEGQNWVFDTGAAANFYLGGLQFLDSDEPGAGSTLVPVYPNGSTNDIMTIITPQAGTRVHVICDGTNWVVNGVVFSATAPTFGDT